MDKHEYTVHMDTQGGYDEAALGAVVRELTASAKLLGPVCVLDAATGSLGCTTQVLAYGPVSATSVAWRELAYAVDRATGVRPGTLQRIEVERVCAHQ